MPVCYERRRQQQQKGSFFIIIISFNNKKKALHIFYSLLKLHSFINSMNIIFFIFYFVKFQKKNKIKF